MRGEICVAAFYSVTDDRLRLQTHALLKQVLSSMKGAKAKNEASSTLKKIEDKPIGKRKAATKEVKPTSKKEKKGSKAAKDPNKPKRPASAFFVFMEEFRKTYKEKNPNVKSVSVVGKAGGDKWKSMSEADKAPYVAKAAKRKTEYEKNMAAYNNKQTSTAGDSAEESDKSKSEVNDEDDDESGEDDDQE